jgi:hypothetical protein
MSFDTPGTRLQLTALAVPAQPRIAMFIDLAPASIRVTFARSVRGGCFVGMRLRSRSLWINWMADRNITRNSRGARRLR